MLHCVDFFWRIILKLVPIRVELLVKHIILFFFSVGTPCFNPLFCQNAVLMDVKASGAYINHWKFKG